MERTDAKSLIRYVLGGKNLPLLYVLTYKRNVATYISYLFLDVALTLDGMIKFADELRGVEGFRYDLVDFTR